MVLQFYIVNKSKLQFKFIEIRVCDKLKNFSFTSLFDKTDWSFIDSIQIEKNGSVFWKLQFNKLIDKDKHQEKKYENVNKNNYPLFDYYEFVGTSIVEFNNNIQSYMIFTEYK